MHPGGVGGCGGGGCRVRSSAQTRGRGRGKKTFADGDLHVDPGGRPDSYPNRLRVRRTVGQGEVTSAGNDKPGHDVALMMPVNFTFLHCIAP